MIIALDHDETFTRDPELWLAFVDKAKERGHDVSFVTYRFPNWDNADIEENARLAGIPIVYTSMKQKRHVFPDADIWIDDCPELCASFADIENMYHACRDKGDVHIER